MVKVIIENDGERKELSGDFTLVTVTSGKENRYSTGCAIVGEFDRNQFPHFLAQVALDNIRSMFKNETPAECIIQMIEFESYIEALVMGEITENRDALNLSDEANFMLDFIKRMKEKENNGDGGEH